MSEQNTKYWVIAVIHKGESFQDVGYTLIYFLCTYSIVT